MPLTRMFLAPTLHQSVPLGSRGRAGTLVAFIEGAAAALAPETGLAPAGATLQIVSALLAELRHPALPVPADPAARVALAYSVDRALGELRRAGTTAGDLREEGSPRALVLAEILEALDGGLVAAGLADRRTACALVAQRLAQARGEDLLALAAGSVTVTGKLAFDPEEVVFLEALHGALRRAGGPGLCVELPRLPEGLATASEAAVSLVADRLEGRWSSLDDPPDLVWRPTREGAPFAVVGARSAEGEARAVVRHVVDALARGTPLEGIAIVVPSLDHAVLEPLRAQLDGSRVPYTEPRGRSVARAPEARLAQSLLSLAEGPVARDDLVDLLYAPGLASGPWPISGRGGDRAADLAALADRLRELPVEIDPAGELLLQNLAEATTDESEDAWMVAALAGILAELRTLANGGNGQGSNSDPAAAGSPTRRGIAASFVGILDKWGLGTVPPDAIGAALRTASREDARLALRALGQGAAAMRAVREAVWAIERAATAAGLGDVPTTPAEFGAELELTIAELGDGLLASDGPAQGGAVSIVRPQEIAGIEHEIVVVTGLAAGAYGAEGASFALIDERLRRNLPVLFRPPSAAERQSVAQAELAWAIAGAEKVILSYSAADGDAAHPLVRWGLSRVDRPQAEPASAASPAASFASARSAEIASLAAGADPTGPLAQRVAVERARTRFFLDPRVPSDQYSGRLAFPDDPARRSFIAAVGGASPDRPIAVTAVERAAGCPFAGFAYRVLRVRRVEEQAEAADGRDRGTMVHAALQAAFDALRGAAPSRTTESALALARRAAEEALNARGAMTPLRREAVRSAIEDAILVVAKTVASGAPMRCVATEQRFGGRGPASWRALEIGAAGSEGGDPPVFIEGQIDRVDASHAGGVGRVVDYKTGKRPSMDDHGKSAFQLPLYAVVVARELGVADVEALYVSVSSRGQFDEFPKAEEARREIGRRRDEAAQEARRVVLKLWDGDLPPRPSKATNCIYCDARDVCRRPAIAPIEEQ